MGLLLQAAARAQAVEIAINVERQEIARMIRRTSCRGSFDTLKAELC
jgi:hypothetical protein